MRADKSRKTEPFSPPGDREICEALLGAAARRNDREKSLPGLAVSLGRLFLAVPYQSQTLACGGSEALVVNLRAFDCVTFVENIIALAFTIKSGKTAFADYAATLNRIRYRRGLIEDYSSRLHYFTDWIRDNGRKGLLSDMTSRLGGIAVKKNLDHLTSHRNDYPPLQDDAVFRKMQRVESSCSHRTFHFIPKEGWREAEEKIEEGDILAITADKQGIDVSHVGFAVLVNKRVRLLHASSKSGSVVLSTVTLNRYLQERRSRTGVIVVRLKGKAEPSDQSSERSAPVIVSSKATSR